MNNIAEALYKVTKIKKRNEVQPENEVSVTPVSVQTVQTAMSHVNVDDNFALKDNITRHILESWQHEQVLDRFAAGFQPVFD